MRTLLRDTGTVFRRAMRLSLRNPAWLVIMPDAADPVHRAVRAAARAAVAASSGRATPTRSSCPGSWSSSASSGALFVGFGLIAEYRAGVIESQRVTPASRTALLLGRVLRDVVVLLVQGTLLVLVSLPLGLRAPVLGVVLTLVVVALLGAAFASISYALALTLKSEDAFAPLLNAVRAARCCCCRGSCCR